jgi:hypothetical protein
MKIEFVMMADAAQAVGGKLFVLGGGWNVHRSGNYPSPIQFSVALSILVPWNEAGVRHSMTVTISDEGGIPIVPAVNGQFEVGKSGDVPPGAMQRALIAVNFVIALPRPGKYTVSATAGSARSERVWFDAIFVGQKVELMPAQADADSERGN